jgi:hypothetical protein
MRKLQEDIRHETERGVLLRILILNDLDWMPVTGLQRQMVGQGFLISFEEMKFHLNYCEQKGLIERKSLRAGRTKLELDTVRATTHAVDLQDGRIVADPGIMF